MYNKVCKVCGTPFEAINSHYCICSDKCRKIIHNRKTNEYAKVYNKSSRGKRLRHNYYMVHRQLVDKHCVRCGTKLNDGRQSYCLSCLFKDYLENKCAKTRQRLYNRGYTVKMLEEQFPTNNILND